MDPIILHPLLLRFLERITVVLVGAMSIYVGYRLFSLVPAERDSSGQFKLPWGISVVMTRVGPGVFFALFGAVTVGLALAQPLEYRTLPQAPVSQAPQAPASPVPPVPAAAQPPAPPGEYKYVTRGGMDVSNPTELANARVGLRADMTFLNTLPGRLSKELSPATRQSIEHAVGRVKLHLLRPLWGTREEGFGDFAAFEKWVKEGEQGPPPPGMQGALELYRYGKEGTP